MKWRTAMFTALFICVATSLPRAAHGQLRDTSYAFPAQARHWQQVDARAGYIFTLATEARTHKVHGAVIGFVVGAGVTAAILFSGGSTSLCDSSRNQDAMNTVECTGLVALGGVTGGVIGFVVGSRIRAGNARELTTVPMSR